MRLVCFLTASIIAGEVVNAGDKFELGDDELELVTAGAQGTDDEILYIEFARSTRSGKLISGEGSLEVQTYSVVAPVNTIYLGDNAQGNLSSLVNINAVNSQISVLLNLNINIDSSVETLNQVNIRSVLPASLPASH